MLLGVNCMETFTSATSRDLNKNTKRGSALKIVVAPFLTLRTNLRNVQRSTLKYKYVTVWTSN